MPPKASSQTHRAPKKTPGQKTPAPTLRASLSSTVIPDSVQPPALILPSVNQSAIMPTSVPPPTPISQTQDPLSLSLDASSQETSISNIADSQLSATQKKLTCRWTDSDDEILINCLKDEKSLHAGTTNGFKPTSWAQAAIALHGSELVTGSKAKDASTCKSRWGALKKLYLSFKTVAGLSGAGWDETAKMISLPTSVWKELATNKSAAGRDLSQWQTRALPLYHDLAFLIEGNTANGDLMITTVDSPPETQRDIGNEVDLADNDQEGDIVDDDEEGVEHLSPVASKSTPVPSKRKRGSAMSPDDILGELKSMNSTFTQAMLAPIPPLVFTPMAAAPSVHMRAVGLVQEEEGLNNTQIFEAVEFLSKDSNAEVYVSFNPTLRSTWLRMKMGW
ncbi:hypothetical protein PGT21_026783 [Puccinia graminis f. sp. tritici]|uniref:Myb/SANT-like domain-containing protein n=1 Tax=Puccinia graminis f. sp. tritici TaxID=56615 RepID=A0A5B0NX97_PUCGR|nr:hypothetical protein PGT21_026783 [Puccinia graminis f. sp. tritici]